MEEQGWKPYRQKDVPITITFQVDEIPESVIKLKPNIWTDGPESYCCSKGHFLHGITGCGESPLKAMIAFDEEYQRKKAAGTLKDVDEEA